jgi:hypothetical protein
MLWVHFDNGRVSQVYAKRYALGRDDEVVYALSERRGSESPAFEKTFTR